MRGGAMIKYFIFFILFIFTTSLSAKTDNNFEKNDSSLIILNNLRELYSFNKKIPTELEREILISLSHYPELGNIKIKFCYASIFTSMKAVPTLGFLFHKRNNRTYRIVMNNTTCSGKNLMQRISPEALTGVLGHELGHIKDYSQLSNFGLIKFMIAYISKKGRIATEIRADKIAVEHNLGKELLEFNEYIMNDICGNPKYLKYKKKYYNSSEAINNLVIN